MPLKNYYHKIISNFDTSKFLRFFLYLLIFFQPFNRFNSFREIALYGLMLFLLLKIFKNKKVSIDFRDKTIVALSLLIGWSVLASILGPYPLDSLNAIRKNMLVQVLIFLAIILEFKDIRELSKLFRIVTVSFFIITIASVIEIILIGLSNFHQLNNTHKMFIGGYANNATFYLPFIAAYLVSLSKAKTDKLIAVSTLVFGTAVVFTYNSRSALIAIFAGILIIFFLAKRYKLLISVLILLALFATVTLSSDSRLFSKYRSLFSAKTYAEEVLSEHKRFTVWQGALHLINERPIAGYGYGWKKMALAVRDSNLPGMWKEKYPFIYAYYVSKEANSGYGRVNPHNLALQIVFEIGFIGLGIFLWLWVTIVSKILKTAFSQQTKARDFMRCSIGVIISYILINITNGFWQETYGNVIFMFLGLVFVFSKQYDNKIKFGVPLKILFIRRDNIGDLVCTTPSIHAVREKYPDAKIGILVNTYNAAAVSNNPDIGEVYIYEKAKHAPDKSKFSVWLNNLKVLLKIRREKYDIAIGCGAYFPRLARYTFFTGAKNRIGYIKKDMKNSGFYNRPLYEPETAIHEVEKTFNLLSPLGINGKPSGLRIFPDAKELNKVKDFLRSSGFQEEKPVIAFHISSRRPENRWPIERFAELAKLISANYGANILLLWSPGSERNVYHPGDDEKAEVIKHSIKPEPAAYKTTNLNELIAALSVSSLVVCCDGGAMHIAAALEKPIVAIWGSTNPGNWAPWGTEHIILKKNRNASDITVEEAFATVGKFLK